MLRSYFITALRHLLKNSGYTALNSLGLSVGLACFALIGLWVIDELSYDKMHPNAGRIYRIGGTFKDESGNFSQAVTPPPLAAALVNDYPEVETAMRLDKNSVTVQLGSMQFLESGIMMVDTSFFDMFSFRLLSGDPGTALNEPYSIILSQSMALKYFGAENPLGKSIKVYLLDPDGNGMEYKITGIIEDCPANSHFQYNFLTSFATYEAVEAKSIGTWQQWYWNGYYTYLMLRPGWDWRAFEAKLPQLIEKNMGPRNREWKVSYDYFMQPITDIHLGSNLRYEVEPTSSIAYVVIFGSIGALVLVLACINYVNLSTAFSRDRFREVGVRKVMGAMKNQLVWQYLTESWLIAIGSSLLAILWMELSRTLFADLTGKPVSNLYEPTTLVGLVAIGSVVGILAGLYPSFMLSSFRPIAILRGQMNSGASGAIMRKNLVIVQYSVTIVLVIGILVVQLQLNFMQSQDIGYNRDRLLVLGVNGSREVIRGYSAFADELATRGIIDGVTRSNSSITGGLGNSVAEMVDAAGKKANATVYRLRVDHDYLDVYEMKLLAGRFLSRDFNSDSTKGYVVNESLIKTFGYLNPEDVIGKEFNFGAEPGAVIGILRDFNYNSLQYAVEPTALFLLRNNFSRISLRLREDAAGSLAQVEATWKKHFPNSVFDYRFADDALRDQYQSEQRFSHVLLIFSGISLGIACMGLFALVSYSVESRTKEIGIRKVLGASVTSILAMLSREFFLLLLLSAVVAVPAGYFLMSGWLDGFAYRMKLGPGVFTLAVTLVIIVAMVTVCFRSIWAARANPVESLRNE